MKSAEKGLNVEAFVRRVAVNTAFVLAGVSAVAVLSGAYAWAARYLASGFWALVFFGLTWFMIRATLRTSLAAPSSTQKFKTLALVAGKLLWLVPMAAFLYFWPAEGSGGRSQAIALLGGVMTPLGVLIVRGFGVALAQQREAPASIGSPMLSQVSGSNSPESRPEESR